MRIVLTDAEHFAYIEFDDTDREKISALAAALAAKDADPREIPITPISAPNLGEAIHTGFRKGMDHPLGSQIHSLINSLPAGPWSAYIDWVRWSLIVSGDFPDPREVAKQDAVVKAALTQRDGVLDELARFRHEAALEDHRVEQILGAALGYPRYCDDQVNFPGTTEADGVCVGEHVPATLAQEIVTRLADALDQIERSRAVVDEDFDVAFQKAFDAWSRDAAPEWPDGEAVDALVESAARHLFTQGLEQGEDRSRAVVTAARVVVNQSPWPLRDAVQRLVEFTTYMLDERGYDGHGWEELARARDEARSGVDHLTALMAALEGVVHADA